MVSEASPVVVVSRPGIRYVLGAPFDPPNPVYEMVEATDTPSGLQIHLNASNCVHCKTCDIMDPYEIITWVPPEGGGGPNYEGM